MDVRGHGAIVTGGGSGLGAATARALARAGAKVCVLDVSQEGVSEDFVSLMPIYIDFGKGNLAMLGRLPFRGESTQTIDRTMALPQAPKGVLINAHHDVLSLEPGKSKKK